MKSHRKIATSLLLASGASSALYAQSDIPIRYIRPMANTVSVGVRLTQSSSKVQFSNLGSIKRSTYDDISKFTLTKDGQARVYDNGAIYADEKNGDFATNERDSSGNFKVQPIDNNSVYVYNRRPAVDKNGTEGYTTTLNPIGSNGLMAVTILDYKKVTSDGNVPYTAQYVRDDNGNVVLDSSGNPTIKFVQEYVKDANGNYIPEELIGGYFVPHSTSYTRYWTGTQGSEYTYGTDPTTGASVITGYTVGKQYVYDGAGRAIGVNMDIYGASSSGASREANMQSGTGFELSFERTIRRESLRFEWGLKGTLGITGINGKTNGTIAANLVTQRQTYVTTAAFPYISTDPGVYDLTQTRQYTQLQAPYNTYAASGSTFIVTPKLDSNGNKVLGSDGLPIMVPTIVNQFIPQEKTIPLMLDPIKQSNGSYTQIITDTNGAAIRGDWQVKGAYYMIRFGPSARFYFSPRLSVSASAGLGLAYYSSRFNIDETLITTLTARDIALRTSERVAANGRDPYDNSKKGVTLGPVAELNAEFWVTARTGFYAGIAYEKLGNFTHRVPDLGEQQASVKLGTGTTIRFGINTRF